MGHYARIDVSLESASICVDPQEVPVRRDRRHRAHSKIGDGGVRTAPYETANVILTRPVKGSTTGAASRLS
jgi:hypothetical protein